MNAGDPVAAIEAAWLLWRLDEHFGLPSNSGQTALRLAQQSGDLIREQRLRNAAVAN
jgi:hypothetical protein